MSNLQRRPNANEMRQSQYDRGQYQPVAGQQPQTYGYNGPIRNDPTGGVSDGVGNAKYGLKAAAGSVKREHLYILLGVIAVFVIVFSPLTNFMNPKHDIALPGYYPTTVTKPVSVKFSEITPVAVPTEKGITIHAYITPDQKLSPNLKQIFTTTFDAGAKQSEFTTPTGLTYIYVVKEGAATFQFTGDSKKLDKRVMDTNDSMLVPADTKFTITNDSDQKLEMLVTAIQN